MERVEEAAIDTLVLHEARQGAATRDQFVGRLKNVGPANWDEDKYRDAVDRLEKDGHLNKDGDRYTITDDGREDVQKVEAYFRTIADRVGQSSMTGTMGGRGPTTGTQTSPGFAGTTGTTGTRRP